ncbi:hypothetical protein [Bacillus sp. JCM 19041]|uniref:hypothetical protein n=1 Tax=Bacillus sp. JCM 19041 TaxID=1460637 RepID=UPI000B0101C8
MLLGLLGSIVPILLIGFGYQFAYSETAGFFEARQYSILSPDQLIIQISVLLASVGFLVGIWGSVMSVRKFLKV